MGVVRIVSERQLRDFAKRHPRAKSALDSWRTAIKLSDSKNLAELKSIFGSADLVGDKTVFNLGGNNFRLIAYVHYRAQIVYVKRVLTHAEYNRLDWK